MIPSAVSPGDAQLVAGALAVLSIEHAKSDKGIGKLLPFIRRETDRLNRTIGIVISVAGSIGISVAFKDGVLTIGNLTKATLITAIIYCGRSMLGQELIYRVVKISKNASELSQTFAVLTSPQSGEPAISTDPRETWEQVAERQAAERAKSPEPSK